MKRIIALTTIGICLVFPLGAELAAQEPAAQQPPPKRPEMLILAAESKLGPVKFNHADHTTKNYNISGTGTIACVECHHTAQPVSEVVKHPPLKTAWPPDRTTTLTAELYEKTPDQINIIACRSCHSRPGTKPAQWPEVPTLKHEDSAAILNLTNQLAFHRNCANCHEEVAKNRQNVKAPTSQQCTKCHKR